MTTDSFVHLHVHEDTSMLDGAAKAEEVVAAAERDGQPGIAITDHGNMYGVLDHWKACKAAGLGAVLGNELYFAEDRTDRSKKTVVKPEDLGLDITSTGASRAYYHMLVFAENNTGYHNLMRLSSEAFLSGYYYKPRIDWDLLYKYHEGLIATTGCLGGIVLQNLMAGNTDGAYEAAGRLSEIFGPGNLFVEVQDHGIPEQIRTNPMLLELARKLNLPLVATNDVHYTEAGHAKPHDALLCIQTKAKMADTKRFRFHGNQYYLKTAVQMRELFSELPEACDNTLLICERASGVHLDEFFGNPKIPRFPFVPPEFPDEETYLRHLVMQGAIKRYGTQPSTEVQERIDYELSVIESMHFSGYFLIVWDLIRHAHEVGVECGPGRGSAPGSCITYCLGISTFDPIKYGLLFERFLNPGRISMPDIDMDFDVAGRLEMIRYATERYGADHVCQIITFNTIGSRAAVKDAARVLDKPYALGDRLAKAMPPLIFGRDTPIAACLQQHPDHKAGYSRAAGLRDMYEIDPEAAEVINVALHLEGLKRSDGIHAAGVVISADPLVEWIPIQRKPNNKQNDAEAPVVTQYSMDWVEKLGLLKMDFLGLRQLSAMAIAARLIHETTGEVIIRDEIPLDDRPTFDLLARGEIVGVFQLESAQFRDLCMRLAPDSLDEVAALLALYRPGPMGDNVHNEYVKRKHDPNREWHMLHPEMRELLKDTYGLVIYQESLMILAQHFAGFDLPTADELRKACGKKNLQMIAALKERFIQGCAQQGYGAKLGEDLFKIIEPFGSYGFNKSHALAYGLITYWTAWFKAHWPSHYMAAVLTTISDKADQVGYYMAECSRMGLSVKVPDVNLSGLGHGVSSAAAPDEKPVWEIRFGLGAIKGFGAGAVEAIMAERQSRPYSSFYDFARRIESKAINNAAMMSLIASGAFDSFGHTRRGLTEVWDVHSAQLGAPPPSLDMPSLFDVATTVAPFEPKINDSEWSNSVRLAKERDVLQYYVSGHPLADVEQHLRSELTALNAGRTVPSVAELTLRADDTENPQEPIECWIGGMVLSVAPRITKAGKTMGTVKLICLDGTLEVLVFHQIWAKYSHLIQGGATLLIQGTLQMKENSVGFTAQELRPFIPSVLAGDLIKLSLPPNWDQQRHLALLHDLVQLHPGPSRLVMIHHDGLIQWYESDFGINSDPTTLGALRLLLREIKAQG